MLAERTRKKLRFAVLRPTDQWRVAPALEKLKTLEGQKCLDEFQATIDQAIADGACFLGYIKSGCRTIFDQHGYPTGAMMQPGDVMDEIEVFNKALETGAYEFTGRNLGVHGSQITSHESLS